MYSTSKKRSGRKKSSSEQDEKEDKNKNRTGRKRKGDSNEKNVAVQKGQDHTLCSRKDERQSERHVRKPVYRLEKTQTGQMPVHKEKRAESKTQDKDAVRHQKHSSSNTVKPSEYSSKRMGPYKPSRAKDSRNRDEKKSSRGRLEEASSHKSSTTKKDLMIPRTVSTGQKEGQNALKTKARCDVTPPTKVQRYSPSTKEELCKKRKELVKEIQQRRTPDKELKAKIEAKLPPASTSNKTSPTRTTKASSAQQQTEPLLTTTPSHPPPRLSDSRISKRAFSPDGSTKDNKKGPRNSVPEQKTVPKPHSCPTVSKLSQKREIGLDIFSSVCQSESSNAKIPKKDIAADTSAKNNKTAPTNSEPKPSTSTLPSDLKQTTVQPKQDLGPSFVSTFLPVLNTEASESIRNSGNKPSDSETSSLNFKQKTVQQTQDLKPSNFRIPKKAIAPDTPAKDYKTAPANSGPSSSTFKVSLPIVKQNTVKPNQDQRPSFVDTFSPESSSFKTPQKANTTAKDTKTFAANSGSRPSNFEALSSKFPVQQSTSSFTFSSGLDIQKQETTFVDAFSPICHTKSSNSNIPKTTNAADSSAKENKSAPKTSEASSLNFKPVQQSHSSFTVSSSLEIQKQDPGPSFANTIPAMCYTNQPPWHKTEVVEELHLARSEKRLELNVMQSYGELTCMEIDPPEEGARDAQSKKLPHQSLIVVLDTNILLGHLLYVKKMVSHGLGAGVGFVVVLIPWVVLQELDSLKRGRGQTGSVAHKAIPAISYIYNSLKTNENRLWGQSMQQAAESANGLNAQNNDDRVLQCCLQYQLLYPEGAVVLCTDDKNLCSKALLSGVTAFSKSDLEKEVAKSSQGLPFLHNIHILPSHNNRRSSISTLNPIKSCVAIETHGQETTGLCVDREDSELRKVDDAKRRRWDLSSLLCEFESCLQGALSDVLEAEMKAGFEDMWLEIVYIKPPWSLNDVLQCFKKHWYAVFGLLVPRTKEQNILNLITYFKSGQTPDCSSTLTALTEAKDLLKELVKSSSRVPGAISVLDDILNKLQTQEETAECDVVMKEDEEDKQPTSPRLSHSGVWAIFENIWETMLQASLEVFKALDFDPNAPPRVRPVGGPMPPRDALACLDQLLCVASQLLQAFSSVLSSAPGLAEVQSLLCVLQSSKIVNVDKLTAADLLDCFSQQEYRDCLNNGGKQLMELKAGLERCVDFTGHSVPFTAQL